MAGFLDWLMQPAPGTQNSAYKNLPQGYVVPTTPAAQPGTSTSPDQMTDADRAYYAGVQNSPGLLDSFFAPGPGAKNTAYKNPQPGFTASMTGQTPADLIASYNASNATPAAPTDSQGNPPPILPTPTAQDQSVAPVTADNTPAGAGGGGAANLPTTLPVATGTPDVTVGSDQTATPDASQVGGGGLLTNIVQSAQQGAQDPQAAKGFFSKLADSLSDMGDKMTNLSPQASQGLISAGLTMLANNSGRMNLAQLVGTGGQAGMDTYNTLRQQQVANQLAAQKQAMENYKTQQDVAIRWNQPSNVPQGEGVNTPARMATGQGPTGPIIPKLTPTKVWGQDGVERTVMTDMYGRPQGEGMVTDARIPEADRKVMNDASTDQTNANVALNKTNTYLGMLSPVKLDPKTGQPLLDAKGQQIPNPDYVSPAGGIAGGLATWWQKLTGEQSNDQAVAQQIMNNARGAAISAFRNTGANRITQGEFSALTGNLPAHPDAQALQNILQLTAKAQRIAATNAQIKSEYLNANRGHPDALAQDTPIMGHTYKAGTSLNAIQDGTAQAIDGSIAGTPDPEAGQQSGGGAAPAAPAAAPAVPAAPAPTGGGRTISVAGRQYSQADVQAAIARKKAQQR